MNNPYAEAYLQQQMNPVIARSYYIEHNGQFRTNYALTSEHQKVICVLIMIALGCYVIGFAIIMIKQVIRDTEQRDDACDCVKYNGEHCDSNCLDEISDEVLREINLPVLSAVRKQRQLKRKPIDISVNMDGTFCREKVNCKQIDSTDQANNLIKQTDELTDRPITLAECNLSLNRNLECLPFSGVSSVLKGSRHLNAHFNVPYSSSLHTNLHYNRDFSTNVPNRLPITNSSSLNCLASINSSLSNGLVPDLVVPNSLRAQNGFIAQTTSNSGQTTNDIEADVVSNHLNSNHRAFDQTYTFNGSKEPTKLPTKDKRDFRQTEIQTNLDDRRLFNKVKSLVLDYPKQKKLETIEHL